VPKGSPLRRPLLALGGICLALAIVVAGSSVNAQVASPTPGASPSAPGASPSAEPSATPSPSGRRGRHREATAPTTPEPEPSGTPTSPAFATLDGSWEVQFQYIDHTDYSYIDIAQATDGTLSGNWRVNGKKYPFTGTYDGRLINLLVAGPSGNITWAGYVDAASDMVGTVDLGDGKTDKTAFTAEHRPSSKGKFFKDEPNAQKGSGTPGVPGGGFPGGR
jgi:hypothetical protein